MPSLYKMVKHLLKIYVICFVDAKGYIGLKLYLEIGKLGKTRPYVISIFPIFLRSVEKQSLGLVL